MPNRKQRVAVIEMVLVESVSILNQVFVFVLGCILGSFYNVVIHRLPLKLSLVSPGSMCPKCGRPIAPYDNVPILSYLLLGGRCRHCKTRISVRYPLVEALAGFFALALFRRYGFHPQFGIEFVFISFLMIIAFIDFDTYLIPDILSLSGVVLGFVFSFFTPRLSWTDSLLGIAVGAGLIYLIATAFWVIRHKEGMGGGDVKLLGMIGAFAGWPGVLFTILVSSVTGMIISIPLMWRSGKSLGSQIPFGPFLALGAITYIFAGRLFIDWYFAKVLGM